MIFPPFAFAIFCVVECAKRANLLDQDDENLLADFFQRRYRYYLVGIIEFTISFLTIWMFCSNCYISGLIVFLFFGLHLISPYCIFKLGFLHFDKKFHGLLGAVKRRELCLFGSAHLNTTDAGNLLMPLKMERRKCLEKLRENIKRFEVASDELRLISTALGNGAERASISEFINEDLRALSVERGEISDDFLQISALRTCWQYLFLVRSEFLRLYTCSAVEASANLPMFLRISTLSIYTIFETSSAFGNFELNIPHKTRAKTTSLGYGKAATLSPIESAIYQLEWALENLRPLKQLPTGDEARNFTRSLKNIILIFDDPTVRESEAHLSGSNQPSSNMDLPDDDENWEENKATRNVREEYVEDFQIFELDTGVADAEFSESETTSGNVANPNIFVPEFIDNRPLLRELNSAISRRKEICIQREITALAKLRKVPVEEISREELERHEFMKSEENDEIENKSSCKSMLKTYSENAPFSRVNSNCSESLQQPKPVILSRGAFGGVPDAKDLEAILRQRRNFPTALAMAAGETFGNDSDSDE